MPEQPLSSSTTRGQQLHGRRPSNGSVTKDSLFSPGSLKSVAPAVSGQARKRKRDHGRNGPDRGEAEKVTGDALSGLALDEGELHGAKGANQVIKISNISLPKSSPGESRRT